MSGSHSPHIVHISVGEGSSVNISMDVDTGAARSTVPEAIYRSQTT